MSPACRDTQPSVMLFAFIKRIVETVFFSAIFSQLSPSKTVYVVPWHAEESAADGAFAAVVFGDVDGELVVPAEDEDAEDGSLDGVSSGLVATVCPAPVEVSAEVAPPDPAVVEVSAEVAPSDPAAGEVFAEVVSLDVVLSDVVGTFPPAPVEGSAPVEGPAPVEGCAPVASPGVSLDVVATSCPAPGNPDVE